MPVEKEHEKILCERLRIAREALHPPMNQKQVAQELGITAGAISLWETFRSAPNLDNVVQLAKLYKVSIDWLVGASKVEQIRPRRSVEIPTVPILPLSGIANWDFNTGSGAVQASETYPSDSAAAIEVDFTSPLPSVCQRGDMLIVLRTANIGTEGVFLITEGNSKAPILRRGVTEGGNMLFLAEDPRYPILLRPQVGIIGRVLEVIRRNKIV